jgi:hypothetical protein
VVAIEVIADVVPFCCTSCVGSEVIMFLLGIPVYPCGFTTGLPMVLLGVALLSAFIVALGILLAGNPPPLVINE